MLRSKLLLSFKEAVLKIGLRFMVQIILPIGQLNLFKQENLRNVGFGRLVLISLEKTLESGQLNIHFKLMYLKEI